MAGTKPDHHDPIAMDAVRWPDEARPSDIEPQFGCKVCGNRVDIRPDFVPARIGNDRMKSLLRATTIVVAVTCLAPANPALAASECSMSVTLANWGEKAQGSITVAPKESCQFPIRLPGTISSSEISQKPSRGKLKKVNTSTFQYTGGRSRGADTFVVSATGKDAKASGTTVISFEVTIK